MLHYLYLTALSKYGLPYMVSLVVTFQGSRFQTSTVTSLLKVLFINTEAFPTFTPDEDRYMPH